MKPAEYAVVLNNIPTGRKNAVSRARLAELTNMTDRHVRKCIEAARRDGYFIIARPDIGGYYIADDIEALAVQYKIDRARALSVLARLKPMREALKGAGRKV